MPALIFQHRAGTFAGFSRKHGVKLLVWFEAHETVEAAILREKRIKKWERAWKRQLLEPIIPNGVTWPRSLGFLRCLIRFDGMKVFLLRWVPAFAGMTMGWCGLTRPLRKPHGEGSGRHTPCTRDRRRGASGAKRA